MSVVFHAPPGWPPPPLGWLPPAGWTPPASWPPAPQGWTFYLELVPSYRRHSILVHPARGVTDPAYLSRSGSRTWRAAKTLWRLMNSYALITVPAGLIAGVVICILLLGLLARGSNAEATQAMQACTAAVQQEAWTKDPGMSAQVKGRTAPTVSVNDVSDSGGSLLVTGVYRGAAATWTFRCQVDTTAGSPMVSHIDLVPLTG